MTWFSSLKNADYDFAVARLFPRGRAWPRLPGAMLLNWAYAIGDCLWLLHQYCTQFVERASFPDTATGLLPQYEQDYGLPDACTPQPITVPQQRAALLFKIASIGGQSAAYFIGVAAQLGYTITITTWTPFELPGLFWRPLVPLTWRYAWRVSAPQLVASFFTLGESTFGEPFWVVDNGELECRLAKIAPAYGVLWFEYS